MSYLLIGLEGPTLGPAEARWLARDEVGGVILFARNVRDPAQVQALTAAIRAVDPAAIVCVDQEGGRVQRVGPPATVLPPLGRIGARFADDVDEALALAFAHAQLMASEMLALGIDLSLAPVLDRDGGSRVIGDRAFHADPAVVKELGRSYVKGMQAAGMAACGKHFPGHGAVLEDTHHEQATDGRALDAIAGEDVVPFTVAVRNGLDAIMMAHVAYPAVDARPAGYAPAWIEGFLRSRMGFAGVVISDDLGMVAAGLVGGFRERVLAAREAGSDFLLVCRSDDVRACIAELDAAGWPAVGPDRRDTLRRRRELRWDDFAGHPDRRRWQEQLACL